jgi:hypothetical protein
MMTLRNSFFLCLLACTMSRPIPYRCAVCGLLLSAARANGMKVMNTSFFLTFPCGLFSCVVLDTRTRVSSVMRLMHSCDCKIVLAKYMHTILDLSDYMCLVQTRLELVDLQCTQLITSLIYTYNSAHQHNHFSPLPQISAHPSGFNSKGPFNSPILGAFCSPGSGKQIHSRIHPGTSSFAWLITSKACSSPSPSITPPPFSP